MKKEFSNFSIDEILIQTAAFNYVNNYSKTIYVKDNLSRLYSWTKLNGVPENVFFQNVDNFSKESVLLNKGLISNMNSIQMMKNVAEYFNDDTILRRAAYESIQNISMSSKLFLKVFGQHIEDASKILVVQNAKMNKTKYIQVNTEKVNLYDDNCDEYITSVKTKTLVGLISPSVVANWNWGHYDYIVEKSLDDVLNINCDFNEDFGGWDYTVKYKKNKKSFYLNNIPNFIRDYLDSKRNKIIIKNKFEIFKSRESLDNLARAEINQVKYYLELLNLKNVKVAEHSKKVGFLAILFGKLLNLPEKNAKNLALAAICHDIGKNYISDDILNKSSQLNNDERNIMNTHGLLSSYYLLQESKLEQKLTMDIIRVGLEHHEKYNGEGYGLGLSGSDISLYGQIISIVDIFDALIEERPYRKSLNYKTIENILNDSIQKNHFYPPLCNFFVKGVMPVLQKINYTSENIELTSKSREHSKIIHDLIGFLKNHNDKFKLEISKSLKNFLEDSFLGCYLNPETLEQEIIEKIKYYISNVDNVDLKQDFLNGLPDELRLKLIKE